MQMFKLFGIICLIFVTGITSSANENMSTESLCSPWIDYFITLSFNIENNSLLVDFAALINSSCTLPNYIILFSDRSCDKPKNFMFYNISYTCAYYAAKVFCVTTERYNLVQYLEKGTFGTHIKEGDNYISPGMYWINMEYTCSLDRVATVFTYADEFEEKKFLTLPRTPFPDWKYSYVGNASIKARFHIRIKHKNTETAISNMPVRVTPYISNSLYSIFHTTPVMPFPMTTAVVVPKEFVEAKFSSTTNTIVRSRLQMTNDISYVRSIINGTTLIIRNKWENIPRSYVQYVVLPINSSHYETIVTTGLVLFREADIVYDRKMDSIIKKQEVTCSVARSVIQEIFSKWLATFEQSDSWFIEGFLTYYGVYIVDQISAEPLLKSIIVQTRREFFDYTEALLKYSYYEVISQSLIFRKLWQIKVFSLFDMFNVLFDTPIQEVIMEEALKVYYLTLNDSYDKQSLQNLRKNMRFSETFNTKLVLTSWTTQVGYPLVQIKRNTDRQFATINVTDCFEIRRDKSCDRKWWIPLAYLIIKENAVQEQAYLPNWGSTLISTNFTKEHFIIVVQQTGYRVNYDRQTWKDIAAFLKIIASNTQFLTSYDITFAQILDDAFYFLVQNPIYNDHTVERGTNNTDLDLFFDLASNLLRIKSSYIEWYPMLTALEYMSKIFPISESATVKDKVLKILNTFLDDTSHKHSFKNSVSNQLYYEVLKWTCILDGLKCKDHVTAILDWHLDKTKNKLLPSWQKWIYCQGLTFENVTYGKSYLLQALGNIYNLREIFVEYLPCSTYNISESLLIFQHNRHDQHLEYIRNNISSVAKVTYLFNMFAKHSKNIASLDIIITDLRRDMLRNFGLRDVTLPAVVTFIINHIYSNEGFIKIIDEWLHSKLQDIFFNKREANFVYAAIINKVILRNSSLFDMRINISNRLYDVLHYKLTK